MNTSKRLERLERAVFGAHEMMDEQEFESVIRKLTEQELRKDTALMKCAYSAKEIKRIVERLKSGERELEQALLDILREAEFIIRLAEQDDR
jgi:hypothetical protein